LWDTDILKPFSLRGIKLEMRFWDLSGRIEHALDRGNSHEMRGAFQKAAGAFVMRALYGKQIARLIEKRTEIKDHSEKAFPEVLSIYWTIGTIEGGDRLLSRIPAEQTRKVLMEIIPKDSSSLSLRNPKRVQASVDSLPRSPTWIHRLIRIGQTVYGDWKNHGKAFEEVYQAMPLHAHEAVLEYMARMGTRVVGTQISSHVDHPIAPNRIINWLARMSGQGEGFTERCHKYGAKPAVATAPAATEVTAIPAASLLTAIVPRRLVIHAEPTAGAAGVRTADLR
jgi:hypothetical protein